MIESLISSLVFTIIIEIIVSSIIGIRNKKDFVVLILTNICTNPIIVYLANLVSLLNDVFLYWSIILILECIVIIVEWKIFNNYITSKKVNTLYLALIINLVSFLIRCIYK